MKCIYCEHPESKVVDSRPTDEGTVIRRRRECLKCGKRFTTYEKVEQTPVLVIKKDGRRVMFDPGEDPYRHAQGHGKTPGFHRTDR